MVFLFLIKTFTVHSININEAVQMNFYDIEDEPLVIFWIKEMTNSLFNKCKKLFIDYLPDWKYYNFGIYYNFDSDKHSETKSCLSNNTTKLATSVAGADYTSRALDPPNPRVFYVWSFSLSKYMSSRVH